MASWRMGIESNPTAGKPEGMLPEPYLQADTLSPAEEVLLDSWLPAQEDNPAAGKTCSKQHRLHDMLLTFINSLTCRYKAALFDIAGWPMGIDSIPAAGKSEFEAAWLCPRQHITCLLCVQGQRFLCISYRLMPSAQEEYSAAGKAYLKQHCLH